jgi:glycogen operon protein
MKKYDIGKGRAAPLGTSLNRDGVNFSIFSKHATGVTLLFFSGPEDIDPCDEIRLDPSINRTYHYWHIQINGIKPGQLYAYRIHGPRDPINGHRFDSDKILIDPYSRVIAVPKGFNRKSATVPGPAHSPSMKAVVSDFSGYDWEGDQRLMIPFSQTIIYEMHVAGFTKSPSSGLSEKKRGTYAGLIEKLRYLQELGITAVELLPVFQFDAQDCPEGKINYWGYSPVSFFAPHQAYGSTDDPLQLVDEFRDMVKALHRAGIEVILDVVFNHTSEGDENGPTHSFRGIDNSIYYISGEDKSRYANYSGTGNTLNANQPIVRRMIIDSLHFWVEEMHVDGFRFDLASILSRDEKGNTLENPPYSGISNRTLPLRGSS